MDRLPFAGFSLNGARFGNTALLIHGCLRVERVRTIKAWSSIYACFRA
jgi:hypothetical protein